MKFQNFAITFLIISATFLVVHSTGAILSGTTTPSQAGPGGFEDMTRLYAEVFQGYDPAVWPKLSATTPVDVHTYMDILAVLKVDTPGQLFRVRGYVYMTWQDVRLMWNPDDYNNITNLKISQAKIAQPDIMLFNSVEDTFYLTSSENLATVYHNGTVVVYPPFIASFKCMVNIPKYPNDENICKIGVVPWASDNSSVKLILREPRLSVNRVVDNAQFYVEAHDCAISVGLYHESYFETIEFSLRLSRRTTYALLTLLIPMLFMGLLSPLTFLIPPDDSEKVTISITVLLATVVYIGVIQDELPDRSDKTSSAVAYVLCLMLLSFSGSVGNTVVLLVHINDEKNRHAEAGKENSASDERTAADSETAESEADPIPTSPFSPSAFTEDTQELYAGKPSWMRRTLDGFKRKLAKRPVNHRLSKICSAMDRVRHGLSAVMRQLTKRPIAPRLNWLFFILNCVIHVLATIIIFGFIFG